ncbi:MAG TPA: hypothetical protein VMW38_25085 [Terriglobia bacterium]|nr:hypothetical protein [Terriglobia bacterium]
MTVVKFFSDNQVSQMEELHTQASNLLFHRVSTGSDRFRQWYYPDAPKSYRANAAVDLEIIRGLSAMKTPHQVADEIYEAHR